MRVLFVVGLVLCAAGCVSTPPIPCTSCDGKCVDVQVDSANCGACGTACGSGQRCTAGACVATCPTGQLTCGGACTDVKHDSTNCGACGTACAAGERCAAGTCAATCGAALTECTGVCIDSKTDPLNCGTCGNSCGGRACVDGSCAADCPMGSNLCGSTCVSFQTDSTHCGSCTNACAAGQRCESGACVASCRTGQMACSGACVDVQNDSTNCGGCGTSCGNGQRCAAGMCVATCGGATSLCTNACFDTQADPAHCGSCTNACTAGQFCTNGTCTSTCPAPLTACSASCVDTQSNVSNCGGCGMPCTNAPNMTGVACRTGSCAQSACVPGFLNCNGSLADGCETAGTTCPFELISVTFDGQPADGGSSNPSVDNSGTRVVFTSSAGNLVRGDTNDVADVFLRDTRAGTTVRLSVAADGGQLAPGAYSGFISGDGRTAAFITTGQVFATDTNGAGNDIIVVDLVTGARSYGLLSAMGAQPGGSTEAFAGPYLSTDGRIVMHSTRSTGLYPGDTVQNESDIYLYDRLAPSMKMASLTNTGVIVTNGSNGYNTAAGFFSGNGRYVVHTTFGFIAGSPGDNCANMYVTDNLGPLPGVTRILADTGTNFPCGTDRTSATGGMINDTGTAFFFATRTALPAATLKANYDIFSRASLAASAPSTLVTRTTDAGVTDGDSFTQWVNEPGTQLAFVSSTSNLVNGDVNGKGRDCFVWNKATNAITLLNQPTVNTVITDGGVACNGVRLSRGGEWTVLENVDGLVPADTNGLPDIYLRRTP